MTNDSQEHIDDDPEGTAVTNTVNVSSTHADLDIRRPEADPAIALYQCGFSLATIASATDRGPRAVRAVLTRAGVVIRPAKAAQSVSGSAIAALPAGEAADIAHRIINDQNESATTARPWDQPSGPNAWRSVLITALTRQRTVVLHEIVEAHLGRPPTRIEAAAAKRAAEGLADDDIARISVSTRSGGRHGQWMLHRPTSPSVGAARAILRSRTIEPPILSRQQIDPRAQVRNLLKRLDGLRAAAAQLDGPIQATQAKQLDNALAEAAMTMQELRKRIKRFGS